MSCLCICEMQNEQCLDENYRDRTLGPQTLLQCIEESSETDVHSVFFQFSNETTKKVYVSLCSTEQNVKKEAKRKKKRFFLLMLKLKKETFCRWRWKTTPTIRFQCWYFFASFSVYIFAFLSKYLRIFYKNAKKQVKRTVFFYFDAFVNCIRQYLWIDLQNTIDTSWWKDKLLLLFFYYYFSLSFFSILQSSTVIWNRIHNECDNLSDQKKISGKKRFLIESHSEMKPIICTYGNPKNEPAIIFIFILFSVFLTATTSRKRTNMDFCVKCTNYKCMRMWYSVENACTDFMLQKAKEDANRHNRQTHKNKRWKYSIAFILVFIILQYKSKGSHKSKNQFVS